MRPSVDAFVCRESRWHATPVTELFESCRFGPVLEVGVMAVQSVSFFAGQCDAVAQQEAVDHVAFNVDVAEEAPEVVGVYLVGFQEDLAVADYL